VVRSGLVERIGVADISILFELDIIP